MSKSMWSFFYIKIPKFMNKISRSINWKQKLKELDSKIRNFNKLNIDWSVNNCNYPSLAEFLHLNGLQQQEKVP